MANGTTAASLDARADCRAGGSAARAPPRAPDDAVVTTLRTMASEKAVCIRREFIAPFSCAIMFTRCWNGTGICLLEESSMVRRAVLAAACGALTTVAMAQTPATPKTHRLLATPSTVAYGYYWAEAKPALRIASGDIIDVDTLLTSSPTGLARAGVPDDKIQASLKAIVAEVTGDRRGPGGHILTGPVYVEGAQPGDVLEVKILSIDFAIDYGYNGCSGIVPENCDRAVGTKIIPIDKKTMTSQFAPGIVIPLRPFFGSMGVAP